MTPRPGAAPAAPARQWTRLLAPYRDPSSARSLFEIAITFLPFAGLWILAWTAVSLGRWELSLLPSLLAAGLLVRLFMIQHDCGHGAFFRHRLANDWVGRVLGVLTLTPYDAWRRAHAAHHAGAGNLARRGIGDIDTLTIAEYRALTFWGRLGYRFYRHPLVMFGLGPAYLFVLRHRFPLGRAGTRRQDWQSAMATNLAVAALVAGLIWLVGTGPFLLVQLPITLAAGAIGVWLFYVQHQFEETYWAENGEWCPEEAALRGSSHYHLPGVLRWLTANIGLHHVHHLASRIPYYRLPRVLRDHPELAGASRLTLWQSLGCVRLALWDDTQKRLVSFREARQKPDGRSCNLTEATRSDDRSDSGL
jgi:acyl-lipid omega-6 desaturase (Delta-12 desaturase)